MKVAVISDTHMPARARTLPDALVQHLREVDLILHAGDLTTSAVLQFLQGIAPTYAVCGNVDDMEIKQSLPMQRVVQAGHFRIGIVHGDSGSGSTTIERARRAFDNVDCIVFGHSHIPTVEQYRSILMVNPGSPTDPRRQPRPSYAIISTDVTIEAEIRYL